MISARLVRPRVAFALLLALIAILPIAAQKSADCTVRVTLLQVNDVYQFAPVDGGKRGGVVRGFAFLREINSGWARTRFLLGDATTSASRVSTNSQCRDMKRAGEVN